jgi:hypothetical protein
MTLQNLLAIQRLLAHAPDTGAILKLLEAARRNLADAPGVGDQRRQPLRCSLQMHRPSG